MESYFSNFWVKIDVFGHSEKPSLRVEGQGNREKAKENLVHGSFMLIWCMVPYLVHLERA